MSILGLLVHVSSLLSTYVLQLYSALRLPAHTGALKQIAVRQVRLLLPYSYFHGGTGAWAFKKPGRYKTISTEER